MSHDESQGVSMEDLMDLRVSAVWKDLMGLRLLASTSQ
jgi:hypothetical protein